MRFAGRPRAGFGAIEPTLGAITDRGGTVRITRNGVDIGNVL